MKTLVDTSVWSLALRRDPSQLSGSENLLVSQLRELIKSRDALLIGPVRQELLSGIRDEARFSKLQQILAPYVDQLILGEDYISAARLYNLCRSTGVESGPVDMLLCAIALRLTFAILTNDQGLLRCVATLRNAGVAV